MLRAESVDSYSRTLGCSQRLVNVNRHRKGPTRVNMGAPTAKVIVLPFPDVHVVCPAAKMNKTA